MWHLKRICQTWVSSICWPFGEKHLFSPNYSFYKIEAFFELAMFPYFLSNPYTRMCVSTIGSFSLFREIVKNIVKHQSHIFFWILWFWISLFIIIIQNKQRNRKSEKKPKTKMRLVIYHDFHYLQKKWKWFYCRYAHYGIRVWRKLNEKLVFSKKASIL